MSDADPYGKKACFAREQRRLARMTSDEDAETDAFEETGRRLLAEDESKAGAETKAIRDDATEALRVQRWHDLYNAVLGGICAQQGYIGETSRSWAEAEADHRHGPLERETP